MKAQNGLRWTNAPPLCRLLPREDYGLELFPVRILALPFLFCGLASPLAHTPAQAPTQTNAQAVASTAGGPIDEVTAAELATQSAALLQQAQASPSGLSSVTLKKYPGHFTMLTVRTKSGGAEQHDHWNDIFIALDGEATVVVGGTIENKKESTPGEPRGTRVVGGTEHVMHKGDIVHISPGVPHQTLVPAGKTFTYYVIKAAEPGVQ